MRLPASLISAALFATVACAPLQQPVQSASTAGAGGTLFAGGIVAGGAGQTPLPDHAVYVEGGIIRAIGPAEDLRRQYAGAKLVEARGATILPGLTDAHGHLAGLGVALDVVDLVDTESYEEVIARVRTHAAASPAGTWILGRGWDQNDWESTDLPTSGPLDLAVPDHPVVLTRIDGHAILTNSAAMRAAGVTAAAVDPPGGRIVRDAAGEPTGVFIDTAADLVGRHIPPPSREQRKARVLAAAAAIAANGLTAMHDAGIDATTIEIVQELIDEGRFPIRVYAMLTDDAELLRTWFARGPLPSYGGRLTVRSVKLYADGALGSRGAALLRPYEDDPHNHGLMIATPEHIEDVARRARSAGFQVNTHAIGDRGVRNVLDAYERAGVSAADRFRVEHAQVVDLADIGRFGANGVIASYQPTHATSDMYWAEQRVGADRIRGAYAWRSVLDTGGRIALGSDFPVEKVNPFHGIHAAVTRQDQKGWPPGGWYPSERLSLQEALRGFTLDAAYAAFEETSRGTIEPGRLADFTIVDGNFFELPAEELFNARVRQTVVGGEIVFDANASQ